MNKKEFTEKLKKLKAVISITGNANYHSIQVKNDKVYFKRNDNEKLENLLLDKLFEFYENEKDNKINTVIAKNYITNRAQSPAVAILRKVMES